MKRFFVVNHHDRRLRIIDGKKKKISRLDISSFVSGSRKEDPQRKQRLTAVIHQFNPIARLTELSLRTDFETEFDKLIVRSWRILDSCNFYLQFFFFSTINIYSIRSLPNYTFFLIIH